MADERLLYGTIEGRLGSYDVSLYRRETAADYGDGLPGSPTLPVELEIAEWDGPKGGDMKPSFGGGLYGRLLDMTFIDPGGYLAALFAVAFAETDYYLHISGPNGRGGTYHAWLQPLPVEVEDEQAPEVYPGGEVTVSFRDGVGRLAEITGAWAPTQQMPVTTIAARLAAAMPQAVRFRSGVFPDLGMATGQADDADASAFSLAGPSAFYSGPPLEVGAWIVQETADPAFSNLFGGTATAETHLMNLARLLSLSAFVPTDLSAPLWYVLPRAGVGLAYDDATGIDEDGAITTGEGVAARSYEVDGEWGGGPGEGVPRKGHRRVNPQVVTLEVGTDVELVPDPFFEYGPADGVEGGFDYWPTWAGAPARPADGDGIELSDGDDVRAYLGRFAAEVGVRYFVLAVGPITLGTHGQARLILDGDDGQTYYGPDWDTSDQQLLLPGYDATDPDRIQYSGVTTEDLPVAGGLYLDLRVTGGTATALQMSARPVASGGDAIKKFQATPSSDYVTADGDAKALPLPVRALIDGDPVLAVTSGASGGTYATLREAAAAERLAQATDAGGNPLRFLVTTVPGLVGPETRVTLSGAAPFEEGVDFLICGDEPDLMNGLTKVALCQVTTDGLAAFLALDDGTFLTLDDGTYLLAA